MPETQKYRKHKMSELQNIEREKMLPLLSSLCRADIRQIFIFCKHLIPNNYFTYLFIKNILQLFSNRAEMEGREQSMYALQVEIFCPQFD